MVQLVWETVRLRVEGGEVELAGEGGVWQWRQRQRKDVKSIVIILDIYK